MNVASPSLSSIIGMDRRTGRACVGLDHIRQSINDILSTPLASRICNRSYGSELPRLIDAPLNDETVQAVFAATAIAIARWYPQLTLTRVAVEADQTTPGSLTVMLTGHETGANNTDPFTLAIPLTQAAPLFNLPVLN